MVFPTRDNSPVVVKPSEESFDFPSAFVSPQLSSILRSFLFVAPMRSDHLDVMFTEKSLVEAVAVVGFVPNQLFRSVKCREGTNRLINERHFVRRSAFNADGDRKTRAVCNCHDLGPLATLGFPDFEPPFLAPEKVPSMKHSERSMPPRSSRSCARARSTSSKTPCSFHCCIRRWHVVCGGYRPGRSFQGAPVRRIQRTPSKHSLRPRGGRPLPPGRRLVFGMRGSTISHCLSVRSIRILDHNSDRVSIPRWRPI